MGLHILYYVSVCSISESDSQIVDPLSDEIFDYQRISDDLQKEHLVVETLNVSTFTTISDGHRVNEARRTNGRSLIKHPTI